MTECFDAGRQKLTFAFTMGVLYVITGLLQALAGAGLLSLPLFPGSFMGALVLLVIGSVFLFGHRELADAHPEGQAFIVVGILLSLMFGVLYMLVLGANALSAHVLKSEDFEDWTLLDGLRPELYLSILSLFGYLKWRDEFTADDGIPLEPREGTPPLPIPDHITSNDPGSTTESPPEREPAHGIEPAPDPLSDPLSRPPLPPETRLLDKGDDMDAGPELSRESETPGYEGGLDPGPGPFLIPGSEPKGHSDRMDPGPVPAHPPHPETEPHQGEERGWRDDS